jgi:hypothetical protein
VFFVPKRLQRPPPPRRPGKVEGTTADQMGMEIHHRLDQLEEIRHVQGEVEADRLLGTLDKALDEDPLRYLPCIHRSGGDRRPFLQGMGPE